MGHLVLHTRRPNGVVMIDCRDRHSCRREHIKKLLEDGEVRVTNLGLRHPGSGQPSDTRITLISSTRLPDLSRCQCGHNPEESSA
eukprot:3502760-Prorocentrum_lima.AAC.1